MSPHIKRILQSEMQKHCAAPRNRKAQRFLLPSPFVVKPDVGILPILPPSALNTFKFIFRPREHRIHERREAKRKLKKGKQAKDMEMINMLFPMDVFFQVMQQQQTVKTKKKPDPIPIRIKACPQIRRIQAMKPRRKRKPRSKKLKLPERGQLIPASMKNLTVEQILLMCPQPKIIALKLFTSLLGFQNGMLPNHEFIDQFVTQQRALLYQEEGAKWVKIFIPNCTDDDPSIPSIYRIFDNTDDGIPLVCFGLKEENDSKSVYRFRVLTKRCMMKPLPDVEEIFLFTQILGMTQEEINQFIINFSLLEEIHGNFQKELHDMVYNALKAALEMTDVDHVEEVNVITEVDTDEEVKTESESEVKAVVKAEIKTEGKTETYEDIMLPFLKELQSGLIHPEIISSQ